MLSVVCLSVRLSVRIVVTSIVSGAVDVGGQSVQAVCSGVSLPIRYGSGIPCQQLQTRVRRRYNLLPAVQHSATGRFLSPLHVTGGTLRKSPYHLPVTSYLQTTFKDKFIPSEFLFVVLFLPTLLYSVPEAVLSVIASL